MTTGPFRAKVLGDGAKYIEVGGILYPLVSNSRHDRLRHGDVQIFFVINGYAQLA